MTYTFPWPVHPAAGLFPILPKKELQELADDIAKNGLIEPVWLYEDPELGTALLDGRNRVLACQYAKVEVKTKVYTGNDPIGFSLSQNSNRRHLTMGQIAMATITAERMYGITVEVDIDRQHILAAKRVERSAPDLIEKVADGSMSLGRADRVIRNRAAENRRVEKAQSEIREIAEPLRSDLRLGDFREVLDDVQGTVDAVIVDPPYAAEYLPLLADLAAWADKALTEDGVLAVLMGQTHLPEVYRLLGGYRPYRWTCNYLMDGPGWVSYPRRMISNWKPVILYGGGPRLADIIHAKNMNGEYHRWGQDYRAFETLVERLTEKGQTVADPMMGGGTTLLAAQSHGRHVIGADIEEESYNTARERLSILETV